MSHAANRCHGSLGPALAADPLYLLGRVERGIALCALGRVDVERGWSLPRARAEAALACGRPAEAMDHIAAAVDVRDPGVWILFSGSARSQLLATPRWPHVRGTLGLAG